MVKPGNPGGRERDQPSAADVLDRVAKLAGAKNALALAKVLGVRPQTIYSWRKRGSIPYEVVVKFASDRDVPLDYLLLGRGSAWTATGSVVPQLLIAIGDELVNAWASGRGELPLKPGSSSLLNYCALIYNRVVGMGGQTGSPYEYIKGEVEQLVRMLALEAQIHRPKKPRS